MVADLQCGVVVNERGFEFIDADPVDAALFTVELDPVQVDDRGENGQLHVALTDETFQSYHFIVWKGTAALKATDKKVQTLENLPNTIVTCCML